MLMLTLVFFFFNDTATTEIYTLSLHDALPISEPRAHLLDRLRALVAALLVEPRPAGLVFGDPVLRVGARADLADRKSTRLNSSHGYISYAVFCLKKKKKIKRTHINYN